MSECIQKRYNRVRTSIHAYTPSIHAFNLLCIGTRKQLFCRSIHKPADYRHACCPPQSVIRISVLYQNIAITDWQQTAPRRSPASSSLCKFRLVDALWQQTAPREKSSKRDEWKYLISRHTEKSHLLDCRQNDGFDAKRAGSSIPQKIYVLDNKENTFQTICWT